MNTNYKNRHKKALDSFEQTQKQIDNAQKMIFVFIVIGGIVSIIAIGAVGFAIYKVLQHFGIL